MGCDIKSEETTMSVTYIVIETHGGAECATICIDESGENIIFTDRDEARIFADSECQYGIVVEL